MNELQNKGGSLSKQLVNVKIEDQTKNNFVEWLRSGTLRCTCGYHYFFQCLLHDGYVMGSIWIKDLQQTRSNN